MTMSQLYEKRIPIAGFQPTSLIDYPGGKLASIIFIGGCNFHCGYCQNPELITPPLYKPTIGEILAKLFKKRKWTNNIVITGGEPLLHEEIVDLIRILVDKDFQIKLDTNGSFPNRLHYLLDKSFLDYVAMDFKTTLIRYHELGFSGVESKILESIKLVSNDFEVNHEFRTTLCPIYISIRELEDMKKYITGELWIWQQFNPTKTLDPLYRKIKPFNHDMIEKLYNEIQPKFSGKIKIRGIEISQVKGDMLTH